MAKPENSHDYVQQDSSVVNNTLNVRSQIIENRLKKMPFVIGVAGGTCCGKSEVCNKILKHFGQGNNDTSKGQVIILKQESFYRNLTQEEITLANNFEFNFDHPDAFDEDLMLKTLKDLKKGETVQIPKYNVRTHSRDSEFQTVYPADVVLFEGILVLYHKVIRNLMDLKVFVDTDSDTRLARRVLRDTSEHNRDIDKVLNLYTKYVKQSFEEFTLPTKKYADVIIPRGADNSVAIDLIVQHIKDLLAGGNGPGRRIRVKSESGTSNSMRPH